MSQNLITTAIVRHSYLGVYCCILVSLSLLVSSSFVRMFSNSLANFDLSLSDDFDEALILMPEEDDLLVAVSLEELLLLSEVGSTPRLMKG